MSGHGLTLSDTREENVVLLHDFFKSQNLFVKLLTVINVRVKDGAVELSCLRLLACSAD